MNIISHNLPRITGVSLLLLLGLSGWSAPLHAEYQVKAAFLYNFLAFTEWPASVGNSIQLCIYGPDPFGADVDKLQEKSVSGRNLTVRRVNSVEGLGSCHAIFITQQVIGNISRVLNSLSGRSVLTVADSPGAARQGIILNMNMTEQNKVTFEANLAAARSQGLNLSSKLLRLATEVYQ